ncbi:MAG TPA: hypothetical protein VLY24_26805 [Bryobacteraceae bacterium]|nr:hypothetical protein [Bryobacteraceae bacterium]
MNALAKRVVVWIAFAGIPVTLSAQWPPYATPAVPKTADGKPNLEGPVPRTADGKPDLSGIWDFRDFFREQRRAAGTPPPAPPGPPAGGLGLAPVIGPNQFFNIGSTLKDGLPFQPWAAELRKKRASENNKDNPDAHCLPLGLMQLHTHPQPRKIIQTPKLIVILYEAQAGVRQIFMDGRSLPGPDAEPWWYGYSIGHWDGDTLVVETNGFRDDVWLDVEGSPLTNAGKMTERFRRVDFGHLEIDVTVDDPKVYTKPWTVRISQRIMLDTDLIEFICNENEKSVPHLVGH